MRLFRFTHLFSACMMFASAGLALIDRGMMAAVNFMVSMLGEVSPAAVLETRDRLALSAGLRHEIDPALFHSLRHESGVPRIAAARGV